jgi:LysM repeat protein
MNVHDGGAAAVRAIDPVPVPGKEVLSVVRLSTSSQTQPKRNLNDPQVLSPTFSAVGNRWRTKVFRIAATGAIIAGSAIGLSACQSSGNTVASPSAAPTKTAIPMITIATPTPGKPGDSGSASTAPAANSTPTPNLTTNGQNGSYTVQPGDTLYGIAVHFNVSVQALMDANSITDPASLQAGQVLVIPK